MIVQKLVRSLPGFTWSAGYSKCYKNVYYARTAKKVSFKFVKVHVDDLLTFEKALAAALVADGHKVSMVQCFQYTVQVWLEDLPS